MAEPEMEEIAALIARVLRAVDDDDVAAEVHDAANRLCSKFPPYPNH
jgi:glycine/serine hydroxymethyltransferase